MYLLAFLGNLSHVHTLVEVGQPLHADGLTKQIELAVVRFREFAENDPSSPVRRGRREEFLKRWGHGAKNVIGKLRGAGELHLKAEVPKLLESAKTWGEFRH